MALGTVALLFTDLVGSTELSSRIGPVSSEVLRREHFALLRDATSSAGGREVKNLGDGLMLAFPSATAAIDAAVIAQQAVEARNLRSDLRFQVRMGVAIGEVTEEDDDYFGEPVVQAARLCALAQGGQVLVTDIARALAGSSLHTFTSVGALELKGLPAPVPAHEVTWQPATGDGMPLPVRLRGAPEGAYVGRQPERTALDDAWATAIAGQSGLVLLSGEPGIGKTRLASHHAFAVREAGGTVLYGAVDEDLGVPYQPWMEAIGHYLDHAPEAVLQRYVTETGPDLARLSPSLARRLPDLPPLASSDGETERYLLLEAVTQLLRAAAADNPVMVVLDDLQWADKPTLLMLTHLHRSLVDARVLFVVTYRDSDLTPEHPLSDALANLRREARVSRVDLTGLDRDDIVELLRRASGQDPDDDAVALARLLHRDTAGNPLFVAELLRDLLETGQLALRADGLWGLTTRIDELSAPASVRDVVTQRVLRLGPDAQTVLATAAVIGRDFDLDLLAAVLDRPLDDLLDTIDAAMAASLLTESGARAGGLRFIHALIAQALVDGLSGVRRAQLHRHVARTIEERHGPDLGERIGVVAGHLLAAGDEPVKTIDYARRAGQHALAALAPDEAVRWFRTALDLLETTRTEDDELRCDLLTDVGEAMREAGQPGAREQLLAAAHLAQPLFDGGRSARAVLAMNRSFAASIGNSDGEFIAAIEAALSLCPEPDARRARLLALLGAELMFAAPLTRRRALVEEALAIARPLDEATLAQVLVSSLSALYTVMTLVERSRLLDELRSLAPGVPDPQVRIFAALHGLWIAVEGADRPGLARAVADVHAACDGSPHPFASWALSMAECSLATTDGDLVSAEAHAMTGFRRVNATGFQDGYIIVSGQLVTVFELRGRVGEVLEAIEGVVEREPTVRQFSIALRGLALLQLGRRDEAAAVLADLMAENPAVAIEDMTASVTAHALAIIANRTGHRAFAESLLAAFQQAPDAVVVAAVVCMGHFSTTLGLLAATLGDRHGAGGHFDRAAAALSDFAAPLLLANNQMEHGRALLELGDPADRDRAEALLRQAADLYARHDCPVRVAECQELLATLG